MDTQPETGNTANDILWEGKEHVLGKGKGKGKGYTAVSASEGS